MSMLYKTKKLALTFFLAVGTWLGAQAQYCLPTYGNQCTSGDFIESFSLNLVSNLNTGCATPSANNYTDYTATLVDSVDQGVSYTCTMESGANWGQYHVLYIDLNQDQDFDDPGEFFDIGYAAAGASVSAPVVIPFGSLSGTTRMRAMCHFGTGPIVAGEACSAQTWGEVEDYGIVIGSPPAVDAQVSNISSPVTGCGLTNEAVTVNIQNNGLNLLDSVIVCYQINGGAVVCDTLTTLGLTTASDSNYTFTTLFDASVPADYDVIVWASANMDSIQGNDTVGGYMFTSVPTITGLPYSEDFEAGTGGWVPAGTASSWEHGVPMNVEIFYDTTSACAGGNAWVTNLTGSYNSNEFSFLESPCIDFSSVTADPYVRFDHIFNIESGFDAGYMEISLDGGATWNILGGTGTGTNWYNSTAPSWDGVSFANGGEWRVAQHILTGAAGQADVRLRYVFTSDGSVQPEGMGVDNIMIASSFIDAYALPVTNPMSMCGLTSTELISAGFFNNGTDTLFSLPVCYSLNGGPAVCDTIMDTIPPNSAYSYDFTTLADLSVVGDYDIAVWSSLSGDILGCNDTTTTVVTNVLVVDTYPYQETFETGQNGWTIDNSNNGTWEFGTPAKSIITGAGSGVNAFTTGGLGTGFYNVNEGSFVNGPCFDFTNLPANSWISMRTWWNSENSWDGANLQISVDTGATWTNIGAFGDPFNWYNDNSINGNPGGSQDGWTGTTFNNGSGGWVWSKHELDTALMGVPYVQLRVAFGSDGSVTDDGFAFDDVAIAVPPTFDLGPDYVGCGITVEPGLPGTFEWFTMDTADTTGATMVLAGTDNWFELMNPGTTDSTYNVIGIYTDTFGLCDADTMMVTIAPTPHTDLGPDTMVCYGDTVWFYADTAARYTWMWNNGTMIDSAMYDLPGQVMVTVTDTISGCSHSDSTMIISTAPVDLGGLVQFCAGDSLLLDAGMGWDTVVWSTMDSTQMIYVNTGGNYTVTTVDGIGCTSFDQVSVLENPLPSVSISSSLGDTICVNHTTTLDAGSGFMDYTWSTGGTAQNEDILGTSLTSGQVNSVMVTVTDGNGCVNSTTYDIYVDPCVSVEELGNGQTLTYYPNPSRGIVYLTVEGNDLSNLQLEVLDVDGRVLMTERFTASGELLNHTLDVSEYSAGVYFIRLVSGEETYTGKLILN